MIKAIIFDFGQTLVDSSAGFKAAEKEVQQKLFNDLSLTDGDRFLKNYRRIRKEFHNASNFSRYAIFNEVYFYYCRQPDEKLLKRWETEYWETVKRFTVPFPETLSVLEKLKERYVLGLVSNTQGQVIKGAVHRISLFPGIEDSFDAIVIAGEDGIPPKPDPKPFQVCLDLLDLRPREAVYVGDDLRIDIDGAKNAGLVPVWIKHRKVARNWPHAEERVPVIDSLEALLSFICDPKI